MKTIQVEIKNVYGTERIYPLCDNAKRFARLTNTKTFNREIISIIKQIGIQVEIKQTQLQKEKKKMKYKGYEIKLNLKNKTVRFFNDLDDNTIYIGHLVHKTLKQIELIILDIVDKRIKYLTY